MRQKILTAIKSFIVSKKTINAIRLLDYRRFDIPAKTIYARSILENNSSGWPKELYKEHLKVWNGFKERQPVKTSFEDYDTAFRSLLNSMNEGSYIPKNSPVGVTSTGQLFDGAHRLASGIVLGKKLRLYLNKADIKHYDYLFFKNRKNHSKKGLTEEYLDALAVEYCNLQPRHMYVAVFFPGANSNHTDSERFIHKFGSIVYKKEVNIRGAGRLNLIHQIYLGEHWNRYDNEKAVTFKAEQCFSKGQKVRVYLFESDKTHQEIIELKKQLRSLYNLGKHSVHITDTNNEAQRLAKIFFNENSIHLINNSKSWKLPENLKLLFDQYSAHPPEDNRCIDSSAVLALYGLRDCRDLDYLHRENSTIETPNKLIGEHNPHAHYYRESIDDIITNPRNHLYYCGYKFASIDVVKRMKINRGEEKDFRDIALIKAIEQ